MCSWRAVPPGHISMLSLVMLDIGVPSICFLGWLLVYGEGTEPVISVCVGAGMDPVILTSQTFNTCLYKKMINDRPGLGFKLRFSFHPEAEELPQLPQGWNCSVPQWRDYQHHFPCDLQADCEDGRDEAQCPYTSPLCGPGQFRHGDTCYIYVKTNQQVTWYETSVQCRQLRGRLLSLNTPAEWTSMFTFLSRYGPLATNSPLGLHTMLSHRQPFYTRLWQHSDGSVAYYIPPLFNAWSYVKPSCQGFHLSYKKHPRWAGHSCDQKLYSSFFCELDQGRGSKSEKSMPITLYYSNEPRPLFASSFYVTCPQDHVTHSFLSCDQQSACWGQVSLSCSSPLRPLPPSFVCSSGVQQVSYSLVCDFRADCNDRSDESFCQHLPCNIEQQFECASGQFVDIEMTCNNVADCVDGSDEEQCSAVVYPMHSSTVTTPAIVRFNSWDGAVTLSSVNDSLASQSSPCPEDHLHCPSNDYCLPVFLRCNGVYDCPGREDEADCDSYTCPGLYRCRGHSICTRPQDMCDGLYHCPQHDDELFCDDPTCPTSCTCYGLAFFCWEPFTSEVHVALRYLEAARSGMRLQDVANNTMLVHLSLALCGLRELHLVSLPNLHSLDVSNNNLTSVSEQHLHLFPNLRHLSLASNPLSDIFTGQGPLPSVSALSSSLRLLTLDMSGVSLTFLNVTAFNIFPRLQTLNLTNCDVDKLSDDGLKDLLQLRVLDLRGCPLTYFPADVFRGLDSLSAVFADNYKLCCPATLPASFSLVQCHAPSDEISSCQNLLRSDVYRGFLALFAGLAMVGNFITFVCRVVLNKASNSFDVFTAMLCVSDFLMGVYLAIIGIADRQYLGSYLWEDITWRHSAMCKVAGFLSIVSSEVSALFICLITLERFLVIRFPLSHVHFRKKSALVVSGVVWVVGVILASLPLLPSNSHWQFYSLNGICVPLPITRRVFAGHDYSFALLIIFNFVLFLFIAVGQVTIFWSVQQASMRTDTTNTSSKDVTLARRLITVAMTDFLCWFPIGLLGILANRGEVNVAIAIFVLPLNSAINPFLYTLNRLLEKRRRQKEERLKQYLLRQMKQQMARSAESGALAAGTLAPSGNL